MQPIISFLFFVLLSVSTVAQPGTGTISGTVKDIRNEPVSGATVRLLRAADSSTATPTVTSDNGTFNFAGLLNGSYLLSVSAVGQKLFTGVNFNLDNLHNSIALPVIVLSPAKGVQLKEVTVTAKRPLIEQEIDKTVVNVGSMISSGSSNTLEVLEKTPGVTVTSNGEISLNGRAGVLVLVDGRSTYMSGQDLAAYLRSLPGSIVEKIELIDNPSARYDAAGNAIINIRLKRSRTGGYTGSVSAGYSQGKYGRNNEGLNLNYNNKKWNLFANTGYNREKTYTHDVSDRRFFNANAEPASSVLLVNKQNNVNHGFTENFGVDYAASANTTYGFQLNLNQGGRKGKLDYASEDYNASKQLDTLGTGVTTAEDKRVNVGTNLNFLHKFGKTGREIAADVNYLNYRNIGDQSIQNFLYSPDGSLAGSNEFLYNIPSQIYIYTAKADYVHPLKNKGKLEAGFKSSIVDNDNLATYYVVVGEERKIDNSKSNHFKYHENINAVYVNAQKSWKRLGAQVGLRVENTRAVGHQLGNDVVQASRFTKDYTKFFPALFVSYKLDTLGRNSLTVGITKRINRPNYQLMNPFLFFRDKYSYSVGNPLLGPQYQNRFELRYTHKQLLRIALSYNRFIDGIFQTTEAVNDILITTSQNIGTGYMFLLNTGLSVAPAKWWSLNTDVLLSNIGLNGVTYGEKFNPSTFVARINLINWLTFNKGWSAEWGGYYASQDLNAQAYTGGMIRANAGVQKKIWKAKGSIRLSFDDIFHSWVYHNRSISLKQAQFYQTSESDTQRIGISFSYRFGKEDFSRKRRHADNASDEEAERSRE